MAYTDNTPRVVTAAGVRGRVTLAGAVSMGDLIGYSTGWKAADENGSIPALFIALEDGASGDVINVTDVALIESVTDATPGGAIYLANDPGETAASGTTQVGVALSATCIYLAPLAATLPSPGES